MRGFRAIVIIKHMTKLVLFFLKPEGEGEHIWKPDINAHRSRHVSLHRVLLADCRRWIRPLEVNHGPITVVQYSAAWPANIQDPLLWQVPSTLERLQLWLKCTKIYIVDKHYGCQVVTDVREWVTRQKPARWRLPISTAGLTSAFSSIIRTQVMKM